MEYKVQKKRRFSKKQLLILAASIVFVVVIVLFVLEKTHLINLISGPSSQNDGQSAPPNTINYSPATDEDIDISNDIKENDSDNTNQPATQNLQVTLTRVTQDENTRELIVRALIEGALSGNCRLELIKDSSTMLTKESSVIQQNNFATCQGFNVSPAEFPSLGEFTVKVTVTSGPASALSTQIIVLEK